MVAEKIKDTVDLNDYGFTDKGIKAIINYIIDCLSIKKLWLRNNEMTNDSFLLLVKALDTNHRFELEELDLSYNNLDE